MLTENLKPNPYFGVIKEVNSANVPGMKYFTLSLLASLCLWVGCASDAQPPLVPALNQGVGPEQESITITGLSTTSGTEWFNDGETQVFEFDIRKFPQAKRVVFATLIRSNSNKNYAHARLYNLTDDRPVPGTTFKTNRRITVWFESMDIKESLSDRPLQFAVQVKCDLEGSEATSHISYMIVYNR